MARLKSGKYASPQMQGRWEMWQAAVESVKGASA